MNKVTLLGRLTKDVTLSNSKGTQYAQFSLAVNQDRNDGVDFINCVTFGKQAEALANYCQKGRQLLVDGRLQVSQSNNRTYYTVIANQVEFLAMPKGSQNAATVATTPQEEQPF